ncbi:mitochondrial aspartate-glutamate transporter agc1, variant 2 [Balamuthia mandrillaris]
MVSVGRSFGIGAAASAIGATFVYPVDLVKTRLQNQRTVSGQPRLGAWACFRQVLNKEGPLGLYKGLLPQLMGQVPEKAIRLFLVDQVRRLSPGDVSLPVETLAGLTAGAAQVLITNPAEIVKVRLQVQGQELYSGTGGVTKKGSMTILKELGVKGMYKGASACFLRDIPFSGIYFPSYAWAKEIIRERKQRQLMSLQHPEEPQQQQQALLGLMDFFLCASFAGVLAASLTTPADVLKTRMQVEAKRGEGYKGLLDCLRQVVKQEGITALFKGMVPRVLRSSPQYGVMLLSYEVLQRLMDTEATSSVVTIDTLKDKKWVKMLLLEDKLGLLLENRWAAPSAFSQFEGGFKHITVGGMGSIWAISQDNAIYRWNNNTESWVEAPGAKLCQLSASEDKAVWGVNEQGSVWQYLWDANSWQRVNTRLADKAGKLSEQEIGLSHVAVGRKNAIFGIVQDTEENKAILAKTTQDAANAGNVGGLGWQTMAADRPRENEADLLRSGRRSLGNKRREVYVPVERAGRAVGTDARLLQADHCGQQQVCLGGGRQRCHLQVAGWKLEAGH